jgi:KDO2-lipid IV(A) lauroyltransferase
MTILNIFFDTLSVILNLLPQRFLERVCLAIGYFWFVCLRYRRRDVLENLRAAFKNEKTESEIKNLALKNFCHYVYLFCELVQLRTLSPSELKKRIRFENLEAMKKIVDEKRSAIVLTAHIGNFEWMAAIAPFHGLPLSIVARMMKNETMEKVISHQRRRWGIGVIAPLRGAPLRGAPQKNVLFSIFGHLKENGVVGFMMDQRLGPPKGIFVNFFGRPAATTPGLAYLVERTDASVIPFFNYRTRFGEFIAKFDEPIPYKRIGGRSQNIYHNTEQYTGVIERMIREHPEQWFWIHRRWRQ